MAAVSIEPQGVPMRSRGAANMALRILAFWAATRLAVLSIIYATAYFRGVDRARWGTWDWIIFRVAHWDSTLYGALAVRGYPPPGETCCYQAFFPGFPWLMRHLAPIFGHDIFVTGFVLTQASAACSALLLWRLTADVTGSPKAGNLAILFLAVMPMSVFLTVVYTEATFLALSLAAWIAARREKWAIAGLLAGFSCTLRMNGLFLVLALVVLYLTTDRKSPWWRPPAGLMMLATGPAFVLWWMSWLHRRTGLWNAWTVAQWEGWGRATAWPSAGMAHSVDLIRSANSGHVLISRWTDVLATLLILVLPLAFLYMRRWAEGARMLCNGLPLIFTTMFESNPRYLVVWFPVYVYLAERAVKAPARALGFSALSGGIMLIVCFAWGAQWWIA